MIRAHVGNAEMVFARESPLSGPTNRGQRCDALCFRLVMEIRTHPTDVLFACINTYNVMGEFL